MEFGIQNIAKKTRKLIFVALLLSLGACAGVGAPGGAAAPLATEQPAPAFDPQKDLDKAFIEEKREFSHASVALTNDPRLDAEVQGHVSSIDRELSKQGKDPEKPCCETRWILVDEHKEDACFLFQAGKDGAMKFTISIPRNPDFTFAIAKEGFNPSDQGPLKSCPPVFGGENPDNFTFFPIGYRPFVPPDGGVQTFSNTGNNTPAAGIQGATGRHPPANNGIQHPATPILDNIHFDSHSFVFPSLVIPSTDADSTSDSDANKDQNP